MTIYDGRESFYQWDLNQKIVADGLQVGDKVHFSTMRHPLALITVARELDGTVIADVPNILLQTTNPIKVYRYISDEICGRTIDEHTFIVNQKAQPPDYFYTETELYELRSDVEKAVENAHLVNAAETTRQTNESTRIEAEETRKTAEQTRENNESTRKTAETNRQKAESDRVTAEKNRVTAESSRVEAEEKRVEAENIRQANFEQLPNNIGNALKGSASGEVVRVDDVSPIEHTARVKISGENIDPTSVTVTRCGKNVLGFTQSFSKSMNGLTLDYDLETDVFTLNGTPTEQAFSLAIRDYTRSVNIVKGKTYTQTLEYISGTISEENSTNVIYLGTAETADGIYSNWNATRFVSSGKATNTKAANNDILVRAWVYIGATVIPTFTDYKFRLQLEAGDVSTETEANNGVTYTPAADGTCEVVSVAPTMTLLTDTAGVTIEAEYNRDTNKVIEQLTNAIISLGGSV